jgi:hypothetical protein
MIQAEFEMLLLEKENEHLEFKEAKLHPGSIARFG